MTQERSPTGTGMETSKEVPETLTMDWLLEHTNMELALRAYEEGVRLYGSSRPNFTTSDGQEKLRLVQEKIAIAHTQSTTFPLSQDKPAGTLRNWK